MLFFSLFLYNLVFLNLTNRYVMRAFFFSFSLPNAIREKKREAHFEFDFIKKYESFSVVKNHTQMRKMKHRHKYQKVFDILLKKQVKENRAEMRFSMRDLSHRN